VESTGGGAIRGARGESRDQGYRFIALVSLRGYVGIEVPVNSSPRAWLLGGKAIVGLVYNYLLYILFVA